MPSNESLPRVAKNAGGVDISASNAGVRLASSKAAPPASSSDNAFLLMWIPPLIIGFIAGLLFHLIMEIPRYVGCKG